MCGAVRYEVRGEPFLVSYCHCRSCRKHNGGPVAGYKMGRSVSAELKAAFMRHRPA